jgi:hypothetical protein
MGAHNSRLYEFLWIIYIIPLAYIEFYDLAHLEDLSQKRRFGLSQFLQCLRCTERKSQQNVAQSRSWPCARLILSCWQISVNDDFFQSILPILYGSVFFSHLMRRCSQFSGMISLPHPARKRAAFRVWGLFFFRRYPTEIGDRATLLKKVSVFAVCYRSVTSVTSSLDS